MTTCSVESVMKELIMIIIISEWPKTHTCSIMMCLFGVWMVHADDIPIFFCWKEPYVIIGQTLMLRQLMPSWKRRLDITFVRIMNLNVSFSIIICTVCADELHWSCVWESQCRCTLQECQNTRHWETLVWRIREENFMRPDTFFTFFSHWAVTIINQKTKRRVWWIFVINFRKHWNGVS